MLETNESIRIHVNQLRIGMRVVRLETLDNSSPFLLDVVDIRTQADIQAIQKVCDYVDIDVKWQKHQHGSIVTGKSDSLKQLSFARSFNQTANTFNQTSVLIKSVFDDIRFGNQFSVEAVKQAVSQCVDQVLESSDAMLLLTQIKNKDEYTAQHSMNVCVMAILLARELNYSVADLNKIGECGLLHDVGKMKVPLEILNKPGKLVDVERSVMRNHTVYGRDVLISARNVFPGAVDVAFGHHERIDGKGYPRGVDGSAISPFTRLIAIVDAYDAITSDRVYQRGQPHLKALGILTREMRVHFDANYVTKFINCIGFYPQGNIVELSSGDVGVVVEQNKLDRLKPRILLILDKNQNTAKRRILDLALNPQDQFGQPYRVKQIIRPQDSVIDLKKLYEEGVFAQSYPVVS